MNKDVVYIEPEDDITDIITKIENSKEKIVALVPPKKAGVFRSIVNIKLISKAGKNAEKTIVIVTTDPSIVKLAAVAKMPVTKNLQSAPFIPKIDDDVIDETVEKEELVENIDNEKLAEAEESEALEAEAKDEPKEKGETDSGEELLDKKMKVDSDNDKDDKNDDSKEDDSDKDKENKKNKKSSKKISSNPVISWVQEHKKLTIFGGIGILVLILVLIWANVIAPAVTVNVTIRTTTANFSENVTFTEKLADEKASEGKFYIEQKKSESKTEVEFEATGKKNVGKKATGEVIAYTYFRNNGEKAINTGSLFTSGGKNFVSTEGALLSWDGTDINACGNNGSATMITSGCLISVRIPIEAEGSGSDYNLAANNNWSTAADVNVYSDSALSGGTDETVTVVQQSDIDKAKGEIKSSNESKDNKAKLFESVGEGHFIIESSFEQTIGDAVSTPAVGEQVEEGKKAKLSVTTTDTVFVVDEVKMKEFIKEKAKLADGYEIYEMNDPFIENFTAVEGGYMGKLKTSYVSGPKVTEKDVVEVVKGKGLGTGRDDLTKEFNGISKVTTETSVPWVGSFPNDENKITVNITVEKQ